MQSAVAAAKDSRAKLEAITTQKDKETTNIINQLEIEKDTAQSAARSSQLMLESCKIDLETAEMELKSQKDRAEQLRTEMKCDYEENLKKTEQQFGDNLRIIEERSEKQVSAFKYVLFLKVLTTHSLSLYLQSKRVFFNSD